MRVVPSEGLWVPPLPRMRAFRDDVSIGVAVWRRGVEGGQPRSVQHGGGGSGCTLTHTSCTLATHSLIHSHLLTYTDPCILHNTHSH